MTDHDEFVNELLENAHDKYDGDEAAEAIAVRYVRDLEALVTAARTLADKVFFSDRGTEDADWLALDAALCELGYAYPDEEATT